MASSVNGADCGATEAQRKGRNEREKLAREIGVRGRHGSFDEGEVMNRSKTHTHSTSDTPQVLTAARQASAAAPTADVPPSLHLQAQVDDIREESMHRTNELAKAIDGLARSLADVSQRMEDIQTNLQAAMDGKQQYTSLWA